MSKFTISIAFVVFSLALVFGANAARATPGGGSFLPPLLSFPFPKLPPFLPGGGPPIQLPPLFPPFLPPSTPGGAINLPPIVPSPPGTPGVAGGLLPPGLPFPPINIPPFPFPPITLPPFPFPPITLPPFPFPPVIPSPPAA